MIAWVYERAAASPAFDRLLIATDSDEVLRYCARAGLSARMTSSSHASGTDRLIEVMEQDSSAGRPADIYVNIQGDEPMVTAGHIQLLLSPFLPPASQRETTRNGQASWSRAEDIPSSGVQVSTLKVPISREVGTDPNAV
jgi:3-deoxy-manno-octulosonate cytidylyltransferase (CMP-KDO synthetase)